MFHATREVDANEPIVLLTSGVNAVKSGTEDSSYVVYPNKSPVDESP